MIFIQSYIRDQSLFKSKGRGGGGGEERKWFRFEKIFRSQPDSIHVFPGILKFFKRSKGVLFQT